MSTTRGEAPARRPPPKLSRVAQMTLLAIAAVALVLLLVVLPAALRTLNHKPEVTPPPPPPGTFAPTAEQWRGLATAPVRARRFPASITTEGRIAIDEDRSVQVTPPLSGRVREVFAKLGDHVARGQPLLSMDATEAVQGASDLASATANLTTARAQLQVADAAAVRQRALFRINGAALKDVQQAESDLVNARDVVAANQAALVAVRGRLAILQATPDVAGAAQIKAPLSGTVTLRAVGPGQFLNATANGATTPIFTVVDLSKVWLVANVREDQAAQMRKGLPVRVHVPAWPLRTFSGRLDSVAPTIDPATRRLAVHAVIDNPDGALRPEMFANFSIGSGPGETAVAVPTSAVLYEGETARVWVARADHTLALRPIRTGRTVGDEVEVLSGLDAGEQVVTSGAIFIDRAAKSD